ncbi:MAG: hypothetical protein JO069_16485 [Verrucomicrobia bacterium]|nr:hypothetical protein [Verrucomicrobiota bacterium]
MSYGFRQGVAPCKGRKQRLRRLLGPRVRFVVAAIVCLALVACAGRRSRVAPVAKPTPAYPAIPPHFVQILQRRPPAPYDDLGTVTVQVESAKPLAQTMQDIREVAAQTGANAAVVLGEKTFRQHNGVTGRNTDMRRTVALLIHRRDVVTPVLQNPASPALPSPTPREERGGPPPPPPRGAPPGATGT